MIYIYRSLLYIYEYNESEKEIVASTYYNNASKDSKSLTPLLSYTHRTIHSGRVSAGANELLAMWVRKIVSV